jgi:type II secretory pathway pseudopilin PulG
MAQAHNADNPRAVPGGNQPPNTIDSAWSTYRDVSAFLAGNPVIQDDDTARAAKLFWDRAKVALDEMEAERDGQVRPLNTQVKTINATFKEASEPLGKLRTELQSRMSAWALAEEKRKAAEATKARRVAEAAEAAARAAEAAEQEAIANAAQGEFTDVGDAIGEADAAFSEYEAAARAAARAERDVKGRIAGGFGRAFSVKTTETLRVVDALAVVRSLVEKTGNVPEKVEAALLSAARDFRKTFGTLPGGVNVEHVRG